MRSVSYVNTIRPLHVFPHSMFNFLMFLMNTSHRSHQLLFTSMVQWHKDHKCPTSLLSVSFTFLSNACHLPLSVQFLYRTSTHFHSHSSQGSLSPSCIVFICSKIYYIIRTSLKNGFDTHICILYCHDTSGRQLSASPTSLSNITSFFCSQLLILFTRLLPIPIFFKKKSAIGLERYYRSTNRCMLSCRNKKLAQKNLPLANPCHISYDTLPHRFHLSKKVYYSLLTVYFKLSMLLQSRLLLKSRSIFTHISHSSPLSSRLPTETTSIPLQLGDVPASLQP